MGFTKSVLLTVLALATLLCGCVSSTKSIGKIGTTQFYQVKARSFCGPNLTALVTQDTETEAVRIETVAGGNGIGHTLIGAAGNAGAAAAFGLSLRPDQTRVNNASGSSSDSSASSASAASGSGATTVTGGSYTRVNGNSANAPGHNK